MKNIRFIFTLFFILSFESILCQVINISNLKQDYNTLKESISNNSYFTIESYYNGEPYFINKKKTINVEFFKNNDSSVKSITFTFSNIDDFYSLIVNIKNNFPFLYKSSHFNSSVSYVYQSSNKNKIHVNYEDNSISIAYYTELNLILDGYGQGLSGYICKEDNAYAFHTNFQCVGLQNCSSSPLITTEKDALKKDYVYCKICFHDEVIIEFEKNENENVNNNTEKNIHSNHNKVEINKNDNKYVNNKLTKSFSDKANDLFDKYLPNILSSKGNKTTIINRNTIVGDFSNDGIDDVIVWFVYSKNDDKKIDGVESAFYLNNNGTPKIVAGFAPDYIFNIDKIENGIIYITKQYYSVDDKSFTIPYKTVSTKLIYSNNNVEELVE